VNSISVSELVSQAQPSQPAERSLSDEHVTVPEFMLTWLKIEVITDFAVLVTE